MSWFKRARHQEQHAEEPEEDSSGSLVQRLEEAGFDVSDSEILRAIETARSRLKLKAVLPEQLEQSQTAELVSSEDGYVVYVSLVIPQEKWDAVLAVAHPYAFVCEMAKQQNLDAYVLGAGQHIGLVDPWNPPSHPLVELVGS
jgi:hypothetical protein